MAPVAPSGYAGGPTYAKACYHRVSPPSSRPIVPCQCPIRSPLMIQAFRSLLTVFFYRNFGLPLRRFLSMFISTTAWMYSVSSLLLTCPNHSKLLLLMTIRIAFGSTLAFSKLSSLAGVPRGSPRLPIGPFSSLLLPYAFHIGRVSQP